MKKARVRIVAGVMAVVSMFMMAFPATAQADTPYIYNSGGTHYITATSEQEITPYLTHLNRVSCDLVVSGDSVGFYGMAVMYQGLGTKITLTLQRSGNNTTWYDTDYEWEQTWYYDGSHSITESLDNLPGGYYYRVRIRACAIDSSGNELEVVVLHSRSGYKG